MAIGVILTGSSVSKDQYDELFTAVAAAGTAPTGLSSHVAGLTDHGVRIIEVWESQETMQQFFGTTVAPILAELGLDFQPVFFEVINEFRM